MPTVEPLKNAQQAAGASFAPYCGMEVAMQFSAAEDECRLIRSACGVLDLTWLSLLQFSGEDRALFLHNMSTNHVLDLAEGQAQQNTLCDVTGHLVAVMRLWSVGDRLWADMHPACEEPAVAILEKHLIMEDVEIAEVHAAWGALSAAGPAATKCVRELLGVEPPGNHQVRVATFHEKRVWLVGSQHTGEQGVDVVGPAELLPDLWMGLVERSRECGGGPIGFDALNRLRVEAGIPWWKEDLDASTLMLEAGLESAIHFRKGCYLGQETLARVHFRGHTNRQITGLLLPDGLLPESGSPLASGGKPAGKLTSAVQSPSLGRNIGLGMVRREFLEPGTSLTLADDREVRVAAIPFVEAHSV